jgi:hypothetical protein
MVATVARRIFFKVDAVSMEIVPQPRETQVGCSWDLSFLLT